MYLAGPTPDVRPMRCLFFLLIAACCTAGAAHAQADLVVHNAVVYTVDDAQPRAQAFAVKGDRFLMVGTDAEVRAAYPDAPRLDARGQTVVPGLIDAHAHLMGLGQSLVQADLVGATSVDDALTRLRAFARNLPEGDWLLGRGWDQNDWPGQQFPTRTDLDAAFPDRPVWLRRIDGHAAWANTAAMQTVGMEVLSRMDDPEGGKIERDARGTPTGIFIDAAMSLVDAETPMPSAEMLDRALALAVAEASRYGLTGVHEAGIGTDVIERYQRAIDADAFDLRLYAMVGGRGEAFDAYCNQHIMDYGDKLTVRSVKFYMDGALGSRGAALKVGYSDEPGNVVFVDQ